MRKNNLLGQKFNRLLVINEVHKRNSKGVSQVLWECQCGCGNPNHVFATGWELKTGHTKSCGCYQREIMSNRGITPNKYDLSGKYGVGYTSKGEEFYFDLEDYDLIKSYHWYKSFNYPYYIVSWDKNHKTIMLHDLIMKTKNVDHIGGSETVNDNRKKNLRLYGDNKSEFQSRNTWNAKIKSNNTSGITGVHFDQNKWCARITVDKKRIILGRFDNKNDAIKARKDAEEKYFKEWSKNNSEKYYKTIEGEE